MAIIKTIEWGDGSGDKIYLDSNASEGNQTVTVSSDANTGAARTKAVTFTAGNATQTLTVVQESGIEPVIYSYLLFDGQAYIDTDIIPSQDVTFRVTVGDEINRSQQRIFGLLAGGSNTTQVFQTSSTTTSTRYYSVYYGSSSSLGTANITQNYLAHEIFATPKVLGFSSSQKTFTRGSGSPSGPLVIGSNGSHSGNPFSGSMTLFRVYGDDAKDVTSSSDLNSFTPVVTLRPCKYDGQDGLWYVEGRKFYGNSASSGSLIACKRSSQLYPSSYDTNDHVYYSIANMTNAYTNTTSSNYATIQLARGSEKETYIYLKFDTSSIPENAVIKRVSCSARCVINAAASDTYVPIKQMQLFTGTTAKGSAVTMSAAANAYSLHFTSDNWTRSELNDIRLRLYAKRGTSNVNTSYYFSFYGAALDIFYDEET